MNIETVNIRTLGKQDYLVTWETMRKFTNERHDDTLDEIWLLEHHPVFTQGQNGKPEHILDAGDIPIVQTDRGGQITYHGPGQLMAYVLIDLKRKKLNVRQFVSLLEQSVIEMVAELGVSAIAKCEAPGVYVDEKKLCSIGLRIRRGCSYHGIAFNINMDLSPFSRINPCGFSTLKMTQLTHLAGPQDVLAASRGLTHYLMKNFGYTNAHYLEQPDGK